MAREAESRMVHFTEERPDREPLHGVLFIRGNRIMSEVRFFRDFQALETPVHDPEQAAFVPGGSYEPGKFPALDELLAKMPEEASEWGIGRKEDPGE